MRAVTARLLAVGTFSGLLAACTAFELSPYRIPEAGDEGGLTKANLAKLAADPPRPGNAFCMAVLSDIHTDYDALRAAAGRINADTSIHLALIVGDLTQTGLLREYRWLTAFLAGLAKPYFTVLGNHDAQANGVGIYRRLFGPLDYAFTYRGTRFVFFNDNAWEFPCCLPDFAWLEAELSRRDGAFRTFAVSHIPPFGDQLDSASSRRLTDLLERHRVGLSIHGQQHNFHLTHLDGGKVEYLVADKIAARNFAKVTVTDDSLAVERIFF